MYLDITLLRIYFGIIINKAEKEFNGFVPTEERYFNFNC